MKHRYIKNHRTEKKGNHATIPNDLRLVKAGKIKPKEENVDNSIGDVEERNTNNEHILFLVSLSIGMILQLMGNNYCVLTGIVVCVSACGFICSWVFFSAVLSHNKSNFLSETFEYSK